MHIVNMCVYVYYTFIYNVKWGLLKNHGAILKLEENIVWDILLNILKFILNINKILY